MGTDGNGAIRAQIRAIRSKAPNAKVFGIFSPGRWTGPSVHGAGSDEIAIYQCDSPLQMRLALQGAPETTSTTVLITPLDQGKVNDDILVRLAMRKLFPIKSWEIVRSLFKAKELDPRITRHAFLADLLLEYAGSRDLPPVAGGLVDADTVFIKGAQEVSYEALQVGDRVRVKAVQQPDGAWLARRVNILLVQVAVRGTVTEKLEAQFTVRSAGVLYSFAVNDATTFEKLGVAAPSYADLNVYDTVVVNAVQQPEGTWLAVRVKIIVWTTPTP